MSSSSLPRVCRILFLGYLLACRIIGSPASNPERVFDVAAYGAKADGTTLATTAIQKAVDQCAASGGGVVLFRSGSYLTGTIMLRSGVTLQLDEGATVLGSTRLEDYPDITPAFPSLMTERELVTQSIIYAERVERIGIRGRGTIDGQGAQFKVQPNTRPLVKRPFILRVIECRDIHMEGVTLRNSASWTQSYLACDNLTVLNLTVIGHAIRNNDGIDIDGCQNVVIRGMSTSTDDDGLCFKGTSLRPTRNVLVQDCRFFSYCNSLKIGTDSQGGFYNLRLENLELGRPAAGMPPKFLGSPHGVSAIALESVDGGTIDGVSIDRVKIRGTVAPIYIVLGDRGRHLKGNPRAAPGVVKNITLSNIVGQVDGAIGCPVIGLPGHRITGLILRNIDLTFPGGGVAADRARNFSEKEKTYPEAIKYAPRLPAYGFFFWHAENVTLEQVRLTPVSPDLRPALVGEDIEAIRADGIAIPTL